MKKLLAIIFPCLMTVAGLAAPTNNPTPATYAVTTDASGNVLSNTASINFGAIPVIITTVNAGTSVTNSATNKWTGSNGFSGILTATNTTNTIVGTFTGNGSAITGLQPSNMATGSFPLTNDMWFTNVNNGYYVRFSSNGSGVFNGLDFHFGSNQTNSLNTNTVGMGNSQTMISNVNTFAIGSSNIMVSNLNAGVVGVNLTLANKTNVVKVGVPLANATYDNAGTVTVVGTISGNGSGLTGVTDAGALRSANNLSDVANAATARTSLGLGTAATLAATTWQATNANLTLLTTNNGAAITNISQTNLVSATNLNITYVSFLGNDASAKTNDPVHIYRTLTAAKNAASAGSTIVVLSGNFNETDLAKNGVNWFWFPATNLYTGGTGIYQTTNGYATYDDKNSAISFQVYGYGTFIWGNTISGLSSLLPSGSPYTGVLKTQNAGTICTFECDKMQGGGPSCTASVGYMGAVWCQDCAQMIVRCNQIGQISNTNDEEWGGIGWIHGNCHVTIDGPMDLSEGPCIQDTGAFVGEANTETQLYVKCTEMFATNSAGNNEAIGIFSAGAADGVNNFNSKSRLWVDCPHIGGNSSIVLGSPNGLVQLCGGAFNYIVSQKIDDKGTSCALQIGSQNGVNTGINWLTSQKVSAKSSWMIQDSGVIHADVINWEDQGGMTNGWQFLTGGNTYTADIHGQSALLTNAAAILYQGGGMVRFKGMTIDTSTTTRTTNYIANVSGSGLGFQNCVFVSSSTAPALFASSGQTVSVLGVYSATTNGLNITLSPNGGFYQNTGVK